MKNAAQKQKEVAEQEAKQRRANKLDAYFEMVAQKPQATTAELIAFHASRPFDPNVLLPVSVRMARMPGGMVDVYKRQAGQSGTIMLEALSAGDTQKAIYFAKHAFNLARNALNVYETGCNSKKYADWVRDREQKRREVRECVANRVGMAEAWNLTQVQRHGQV